MLIILFNMTPFSNQTFKLNVFLIKYDNIKPFKSNFFSSYDRLEVLKNNLILYLCNLCL